MGRHNHIERRNIAAHYDTDVIFRTDLPHVRIIVDHTRKTVFRNVEALPNAEEVLYVRY